MSEKEKLENIKIPKHFVKPKQKKLKERLEYFAQNKIFKVPIVINKNGELIDGYTSYLVAKRFYQETVEVVILR